MSRRVLARVYKEAKAGARLFIQIINTQSLLFVFKLEKK